MSINEERYICNVGFVFRVRKPTSKFFVDLGQVMNINDACLGSGRLHLSFLGLSRIMIE